MHRGLTVSHRSDDVLELRRLMAVATLDKTLHAGARQSAEKQHEGEGKREKVDSAEFAFFSHLPCFFLKKNHMQQNQVIPVCTKCGGPCVQRTVRREGPNKGRLFWGCAKPQDVCSGVFHWCAPAANAVQSAPSTFPLSPFAAPAPAPALSSSSSSSISAPTTAALAQELKTLSDRVFQIEHMIAMSRAPAQTQASMFQ